MTPEQEQLILDNMRLVHYFARKLAPRLADGNSYDYEDLVGEGQIALIKAAKRFDPDKGFKFNTFAGTYIDGVMRKFLSEHVPTVKHSPIVVRLANKMIPMEKLKELLLENKTSVEIGKMYGIERMGVEKLKRSYKMTKARLGVSYHDRHDTYKPEHVVEDIVIDIPKTETQKPAQTKLPEWVERLLTQGDSRIIINAQNITINIGA